jgi:hypothetical protein
MKNSMVYWMLYHGLSIDVRGFTPTTRRSVPLDKTALVTTDLNNLRIWKVPTVLSSFITRFLFDYMEDGLLDGMPKSISFGKSMVFLNGDVVYVMNPIIKVPLPNILGWFEANIPGFPKFVANTFVRATIVSVLAWFFRIYNILIPGLVESDSQSIVYTP